MERPRRPASDAPTESLDGSVERIVFASDENGWSVVRIETGDHSNTITAVGNLVGVQPGERLRLTGRWIQDRRWGRQFQVASYISLLPATVAGIERYLGSGLVPGIGKVMARRLVGRFGLETLDILEHQPKRLREVDGIGAERSDRLQVAWAEQRHVRDVMVFLQGHGLSPRLAARIVKLYGDTAMARVREHPYALARDMSGIGFLAADRIAASLGIARDSPERAEAAVAYVVDERAGEGHVFVPRQDLEDRTLALLDLGDGATVRAAIERLAAQQALVVEPLPDAAGDAVYGTALHTAETGVARCVANLMKAPSSGRPIDAEAAVAWYERQEQVKLSALQQEAVRRGLTSKILVVTGGPGTGKTTLVRAVLKILQVKGARVLLAAPTGRAAKRLAEATGQEARTLHRLLEFDPRRRQFARTPDNPLEADLVIVDETSMVDLPLAHHLLRALPPPCRLILVGDIDQLPSVGPGSVLADIIASGAVDVVRLTEIFRQAERSHIVASAHRIRIGQLPVLDSTDDTADFYFIRRDEPEEVLETIKDLVVRRVPARFGLDPIEQIQVLTPMNRGLLGTFHLNTTLQALLNPGSDKAGADLRTLRRGDKVMQTRNNYDLDVFNGDLGRVVAVDSEAREVQVRHDGRVVTYGGGELDELVLAYACSIHKAQGSEYPAVIIPIHTQHAIMLRRNLLYTAVTRGRRLVILVGSHRALGMAVRNARVQVRHTRLAERLRG